MSILMLPAEFVVFLAQEENDRQLKLREIDYWTWLAESNRLVDILQDVGLAPIDPPEAG